MRNDLKVYGHVTIVIRDLEGNVVRVMHARNLIVDVGKQVMIDILLGTDTSTIGQIGVGSDGTAPASTDTDLLAPILWKNHTDRWRVNNELHVNAFFSGNEANGTWREVGLRSYSNVLVARTTITDWVKTSSYTATVEWTLTFV